MPHLPNPEFEPRRRNAYAFEQRHRSNHFYAAADFTRVRSESEPTGFDRREELRIWPS